jgi:cytochrome c peroxidase
MGHNRTIPCSAAGTVLIWLALLTFLPVAVGTTQTDATAEKPAVTTLWTAEEWARARRFSPLPAPPPDPTNALADNLQAARLGQRLFFDSRLSPHGVSCATCHVPERGFTDSRPVAETLAPLHRNTMTILNVGHYRWLTWDGASDSLWHQAALPIENPREMGSSRLYVVQVVMRYYGQELAQLVPLPAGWETLWPTLPATGASGQAAFDTLSPAQQEAVTRVFVTILKSLAAYERQMVSAPAPFDRFVAGDQQALTVSAQRGFQHFLRLECATCHSTPLFSDDEFHNLGLPAVPAPDEGRAEGLRRLQHSPLRGSGAYSDGPPLVHAEDYQMGASLRGSFRTPSLRELQYTAPYGHNGALATLADWLKHYKNVFSLPPERLVGRLDPTLEAVEITPQEQQELEDFLCSLSSDYASPWTEPPVEVPPSTEPATSSRKE